MNIAVYIKNLITDAHRWQKNKIGNDETKDVKSNWYSFSIAQFFFIIVSILYIIFKHTPFNFDLIGYVSAMFSIFVGLLLSLLILMFDKYQNIDFNLNNVGVRDGAYRKKLKRFFIQFNTLTTYSILIAILNIILLLLCFIFDELNSDTSLKKIVEEIFINKTYEWAYLKNLLVLLYRGIIIYFVLDFFYLLVFSLTSIYSFINKEYNK